MAFVIERKDGAPKAEMPDNVFAPLDAGYYDAYIYDVKFKEFGGSGPNAGRPAYNISFKIAPEQKFAGRVLFLSPMLLLADRWAPNDKNPDGYPNGTLWEFLAAVDEDGRPPKAFVDEFNENGTLEIPEPRDLVGTLVNIRVGVELDPWAWEKDGSPEGKKDEYKRNTIRTIRPAQDSEEENVVSAKTDSATGKQRISL